MRVNVLDILSKVYGARGIPFPGKTVTGNDHGIGEAFTQIDKTEAAAIAGGFGSINVLGKGNGQLEGTPVKRYIDESLGQYVFMPVYINGYALPNPVIMITGEKRIIETDIIEIGTVFEKVFIKPYDITIIVTLISEDGEWPGSDLNEVIKLWQKDGVLTLRSALTDKYLEVENNFLITKIAHLDVQGAENVEIVQIDGRSNIDFELEIN